MTKTVCVVTLLTGLALAVPAGAQTPATGQGKTVIAVNVGAHLQKHPFTTANSFPLFGETATFETKQSVNTGLMFDVSGARSIGWRSLSIAAGISVFSKSSNAAVTASIPHPAFFNRFRTTNISTDDLSHSQLGIHISAVWTMPLTQNIDVALAAGPSFTRVSQELVQSVAVDAATQVASPLVVRQTGVAKGGNVGADVRYHITNMYSAGMFVRYVHGTTDLESSANLRIGGAQAGIGIRIRLP